MAQLQSDRLTAGYMRSVSAIRDRVLAFALAMWDSASSLRDADVDQIVARIVPVVESGQLQVANLTNAYIAGLAVSEGVVAEAALVDRDAIVGYRGVAAGEVYRRPAVMTYTELAAGKTFEVARAVGRSRLADIVSTDLQQARNRQAEAGYSGAGFDYQIRVLSGAENCALCVIASTQRYRKAKLMPIHPGCDCGQRGVRAAADPGQVIDPDLLEFTHMEIDKKLGLSDRGARDHGEGKTTSAGNPISDYTDLIVSRTHGELGPTLVWRADKFTGPSGIAA